MCIKQNVVDAGYVFLLVTKTQIFPTTLDLGLGPNAAGWHETKNWLSGLKTQALGEHKCIKSVHPLKV